MPRGGARPGAGRKPKPKTEAERTARQNAKQKNEQMVEAAFDDLTPLEYMLNRMRDPNVTDSVRDKMAMAAAPYIHSKLVTTDVPDNANNRESEKPSGVAYEVVDEPANDWKRAAPRPGRAGLSTTPTAG